MIEIWLCHDPSPSAQSSVTCPGFTGFGFGIVFVVFGFWHCVCCVWLGGVVFVVFGLVALCLLWLAS